MDWRRRINDLVNGDGPIMVFQPIYRLSDETLVGYEALARFPESRKMTDEELKALHGPNWKDNAYIGMGPDIWFRQADLLGLGTDLEISAICAALDFLPSLNDGLYIAVNVGPETLVSGELSSAVRNCDLSRVVVELTEHLAITDYRAVKNSVMRLQEEHSAKVCTKIPGIAADDVGSGSASLMHLLELGDLLEFCKMDVSLTNGIETHEGRQAIAATLVAMSKIYGYKIVAEGVENKKQLAKLKEIGIFSGQGWFLGKPGPLPERKS